jgi:hypothetical protein
MKPTVKTTRSEITKLRRKAAGERLENLFALKWRSIDAPQLEREFKFHATRDWRFDFCHLYTKTAIEIQGGIWMRYGAHNTGSAITRDCEKSLAATLLGWTVIHLVESQITSETLLTIRDFIMRRRLTLDAIDAYRRGALNPNL